MSLLHISQWSWYTWWAAGVLISYPLIIITYLIDEKKITVGDLPLIILLPLVSWVCVALCIIADILTICVFITKAIANTITKYKDVTLISLTRTPTCTRESLHEYDDKTPGGVLQHTQIKAKINIR